MQRLSTRGLVSTRGLQETTGGGRKILNQEKAIKDT